LQSPFLEGSQRVATDKKMVRGKTFLFFKVSQKVREYLSWENLGFEEKAGKIEII